MPEDRLPAPLLEELKGNLERLRRDLTALDEPDAPWAVDYAFQEYEALGAEALQKMGRGTVEILTAFYKALRVLSEGHAGLLGADEQALERAYRLVVEAAIELGEWLLEQGKPL